jgi:hypothetical protein
MYAAAHLILVTRDEPGSDFRNDMVIEGAVLLTALLHFLAEKSAVRALINEYRSFADLHRLSALFLELLLLAKNREILLACLTDCLCCTS